MASISESWITGDTGTCPPFVASLWSKVFARLVAHRTNQLIWAVKVALYRRMFDGKDRKSECSVSTHSTGSEENIVKRRTFAAVQTLAGAAAFHKG